MKTIEIKEVYYSVTALYQRANSENLRALLGYILKTGKTRDPLYTGAFSLVREIEDADEHGHIYGLMPISENSIQIVAIAERAMQGRYDPWIISEREVRNTLALINKANKKEML